MTDTIQVPTLTPEQQAEHEIFIKKKQLFILALTQAINNGMTKLDCINEEQLKFLYADLQNTVPTTQGISTIDFMVQNGGYKTIVFSHEFLKAFFGEYWKEHGYQLLITEQPLFYLEQFFKPILPKQEWK